LAQRIGMNLVAWIEGRTIWTGPAMDRGGAVFKPRRVACNRQKNPGAPDGKTGHFGGLIRAVTRLTVLFMNAAANSGAVEQ